MPNSTPKSRLVAAIRSKQSFLCVGLDPVPERMPEGVEPTVEGMERFCLEVMRTTADHAVAFKPNLAFFEQYGSAGWAALERIVAAAPEDCLVIADAKRGDIGSTATCYARAFFESMNAGGVTVAPYMGADSVTPFTAFADRWTVLLALTSNPSADDFEFHGSPPLHEHVVVTSSNWGTPENLMYVVGATRPEGLRHVRSLAPDHFFLVPGVGAQGGSVQEVAEAGWNAECGLLVNSSRGILYASNGADYADAARAAAASLHAEMREICQERGL
jgi:orotidine-5'-phosphate decarboxylase